MPRYFFRYYLYQLLLVVLCPLYSPNFTIRTQVNQQVSNMYIEQRDTDKDIGTKISRLFLTRKACSSNRFL